MIFLEIIHAVIGCKMSLFKQVSKMCSILNLSSHPMDIGGSSPVNERGISIKE